MKKNLEKKFQLFLHIFTDKLKNIFHPANNLAHFFTHEKTNKTDKHIFLNKRKKKRK